MLTTPTSAWLAGCGAWLVATLALFFVLGIVLALLHVPATANESISKVALIPLGLVAAGVGIVVLRKRRQPICPICRTASITPPPAR